MNMIIGLIIATVVSWLNFVIVDTYLGLPESPGVKGAENVGYSIKKRGGDLSGGFFQGNILCSPDASAGTLLASIGVYILGVQGGLIAALLVFIGNRLCADNGYAGVVGSLTMTAIVVHMRNGDSHIHNSGNLPSGQHKAAWKNCQGIWQIHRL